MTEDEIMRYAKNYKVLKKAVMQGDKEVIITSYRKKELVVINYEIIKLIDIMDLIYKEMEDEEYIKAFNFYFVDKLKEKRAIAEMHVSLSTYHRFIGEIKTNILLLGVYYIIFDKEEIIRKIKKV